MKAAGALAVWKSSQSRGPFDVGAIMPDGIIRLIQVKSFNNEFENVDRGAKERPALLKISMANPLFIQTEIWQWRLNYGWTSKEVIHHPAAEKPSLVEGAWMGRGNGREVDSISI